MANRQERLKMITDAVLSNTIEESNALKEKADDTLKKEISDYREETTYSFFEYMQKSTMEIRKKTITKASKKELEAWSEFFEKRQELEKGLFDSVAEEVREYSKTEEYKNKMLQQLKDVAEKIGKGKVEVYICETGEDLKPEIEKIFDNADISIDKTIFCGGWKFENDEKRIFIDGTLDTKLNEQKQWFYENSKLTLVEQEEKGE